MTKLSNPLLDELIDLRLKKGFSQTDIRNELNVNKNTMSGYETGKVDIPTMKLIKYAEFLGVRVGILH